MEYIRRIKEEFEGLSHSTVWQIITNRTYGEYYHLLHPCRAERSILEKYIPDSMSIDELLPKVQQKKKELAKRFNIKKFPPDREPGYSYADLSKAFQIIETDDFKYLSDLATYYFGAAKMKIIPIIELSKVEEMFEENRQYLP